MTHPRLFWLLMTLAITGGLWAIYAITAAEARAHTLATQRALVQGDANVAARQKATIEDLAATVATLRIELAAAQAILAKRPSELRCRFPLEGGGAPTCEMVAP